MVDSSTRDDGEPLLLDMGGSVLDKTNVLVQYKPGIGIL